MVARTTKSSVTFDKAFTLGDRDEVFPPGTYAIETEEELLEGLTFMAFRKTQISIVLPAGSGHSGSSRTLMFEPKLLDAALNRDRNADERSGSDPAIPNSGAVESDTRAMDRAEDEGMIIQPT